MSTGHLETSFATAHQELWKTYLKPRIVHIQGISLRDNPDIIQLARQKLDDEVAVLLTAVSILRTRHNALSCIASLPSEVLARIFYFEDKAISPLNLKNKFGWIRVTHVCRFWRETALQHPSLWNEVTDTLGPKWMNMMLVRAKSAPISYSQCFSGRLQRDKVITHHAIAAHLFHMRHLSIDEPPRIMNPILQTMTTSPAPILESLQLHSEPEGSHADEDCVLPSDIFTAHAPRLRRLELCNIQVPWSAPILRGLTHLDINNSHHNPPATDGDVTIYMQFFCALREMPTLQDLSLSYCLPVEPRAHPSIQTVMLPHVEKLTLRSGSTAECADVIKNLQMTPSCDVTIKCTVLDPIPFQSIISCKVHTPSTTNQLPLLTMSLSTTSGHPFYRDPIWQLRFWPASSSPDLADLHQDRKDPSTSILVDMQEDDMTTDLQALYQSSPKDIIRDLIIRPSCIDWTLTPGDWIFVLGRYTAVENMAVEGEVAHALCGALGVSHLGLPEGTDDIQLPCEQLFLRNLKRIEFKKVNFHASYEIEWFDDDGESSSIINTEIIYDMLKTSLSRRRAASDIALTLFIRECSINPEQIRGLQEIADVDWDYIQVLSQGN